jgi:predicted ATPase/class 3 adenylate cyclase
MATQLESGPPSARPTGTVSFLFSDIEGSAARWDGDRDAMASALARHDALMRATLEACDGYVFKTMGDAVCAVFARAEDAIAAALEAQRALRAEDFSAVAELPVRMALHTGTAEERDGDYFGPAVNRVARLLAIGHGGQVLVSGVTADLLQGEMPAQSSLRDLGAHRLKDLARPEQVYQLIAPDLPEAFPALRSLDELPNNLPRRLTSFVGREDVVAEVVSLVEQFPLVTLVGTGGAGKTRCAVQVGAELLDGSGDGVWLAELAPISDPALVTSVITQALNVQEQPNRPILDTLLAYLKRKHLLLILDNCEHVIDEARRVAGAILQACPDVRILATSREGLNIAGEETYRMPSLAVPSNEETLSTDGVTRYAAVQLFIDRALSSNKRFSFTEENAPHVAEICRRLDGIPLAIELAAARVKVLSPQQLAQKLDERFRVLTGGDRSALPRQQTMRALIDWSYDLLAEDERGLFRKLSIFAGGFTLESATAICGDEAIDEIAMLDLLTSLVDKSLVQAELVGSGTRYRLLESTRQYAREKLSESGEYELVAHAHASAFVALAEQLHEIRDTTPERAWSAQSESELENFRAALAWALGPRGDALLGQRLAGALRSLSDELTTAEGRGWVHAAQELVTNETPLPVLAALDLADAVFASGLTQYKASLAAGERALASYGKLGDSRELVTAQNSVGRALVLLGNVAEGEALLTQALSGARALRQRRLTMLSLRNLGVARQIAGDLTEARRLYSEALAIARNIGAERSAAITALNLAEAEFRDGNAEAALRLASDALTVYRTFSIRVSLMFQCNIAAYLLALRRYDEARLSARGALSVVRDGQWDVGVAIVLQHLAAVSALRQSADGQSCEELARAARLLGYVDASLAALDALREYTEQQGYDAMVPALRDGLGADDFLKLMAEGSTWSEDQAVAEAMLI